MVKGFIIILQESEYSYNIGQDSITSARKFGIDLEVHHGVNGFDSRKLFDRYGIKRFLTRTIIDYPGHQGCFLSHFQLWKKCLDINEPILILEHDGVFIRELPGDVLNHFTDVLFLDSFSPYDSDYEVNVENSLCRPIKYHRPKGQIWHAVGEHLSGAYGYIIKPQAADKLINFAIDVGAAPTDIHMGRNIVDLVSTTETVVRLHNSYNDKNIKEKSSTENLSQYILGDNQIARAEYLTPKKYKKLEPK